MQVQGSGIQSRSGCFVSGTRWCSPDGDVPFCDTSQPKTVPTRIRCRLCSSHWFGLTLVMTHCYAIPFAANRAPETPTSAPLPQFPIRLGDRYWPRMTVGNFAHVGTIIFLVVFQWSSNCIVDLLNNPQVTYSLAGGFHVPIIIFWGFTEQSSFPQPLALSNLFGCLVGETRLFKSPTREPLDIHADSLSPARKVNQKEPRILSP